MLRQIDWEVQHGPATKNGLLPLTTSFFWKFSFSFRTSYKYWFNILIAQVKIFILFRRALVLFEGIFYLLTSLKISQNSQESNCVGVYFW